MDVTASLAEVIEKEHAFLFLNACVSAIFGIGGSWVFRVLNRKDAVKAGEVARLDQASRRLASRYEVYRIYADPLLIAARSLSGRLNEFAKNPERDVWFEVDKPQSPFVEYKYVGTVYRLAAFLGWIRAFRRDRVRLDPFDMTNELSLADGIKKIEGILADGNTVEQQRTDNLLRHWRIALPERETSLHKKLCGHIDGLINQARHWDGGYKKLRELNVHTKVRFCEALAEELRHTLNLATLPAVTQADAIAIVNELCIHEALIYRDVQQAIGDMVLIENQANDRRFEVMGFRGFVEHFGANGTRRNSADARWLNDLENLFRNLDMSKTFASDARPQIIRDLHEELRHLVNGLERVQASVEAEAAHLENAKRRLEKAGGVASPAETEPLRLSSSE